MSLTTEQKAAMGTSGCVDGDNKVLDQIKSAEGSTSQSRHDFRERS